MVAGERVAKSVAAPEPSGSTIGRFIVKSKYLVASLAAVLALSPFFSPTASAGEDLGETLMRKFFADAKSHNLPAIEKTLAEGFQSVHTDGASDRAGELEIVRNIKLGTPTLANFKTTRNGPVLVVTFEVSALGEIIEGKRVGEGFHERLAVWLETNSGWQLIAYANLAPLN